ncbi:MAG: hypothetical protein M9921_13070 [Fimbriimonadaceae bacterium]|nr:hypothetical protein [Fimbriimonadaceae bacterium]
MGKTLNFGDLPLMRAEYGLAFAPSPPGFDEIARIRNIFSKRLPHISDFSGGGSFTFSIGREIGVGLDDLSLGIGLALRHNRLIVAWQRLKPEMAYVRFETLQAYLAEALDLIEPRSISKAVGFYVNLIPDSHGDPIDLVSKELFPRLPDGNVSSESRGSWEIMGGRAKLSLTQVPEGAVLDTRFSMAASDNPMESIGRTHDALIGFFDAIITDEARRVWKLEH